MVKFTSLLLAGATARVLDFQDGPRAGNQLYHSQCSGDKFYGTLEQAKDKCAKDINCEWLHDYGCDGRNWRFCGTQEKNGQSTIASGDNRACTKIASERVLEFKRGPKVGNSLYVSQCKNTKFYGTLEEAQRRCALDQSCEWLHDYGCDDKSWRFCGTKGTAAEPMKNMKSGDKRACTMTAARPVVEVKKCHDVLHDKAIHWAEYDATKTWGPYVAMTGRTTQQACIKKCEETKSCAGWSYRYGNDAHEHHKKCFLLDSSHTAYAPKDAKGEFHSGVCKTYVKTCNKILPDAAIHLARYDATKTWGPYITGSPILMTQNKCIQECEANEKCDGWSYRDENPKHVHYKKCFLLDSSHTAYAPKDHGGGTEFNSAKCEYSQQEIVDVEMAVDLDDKDIKIVDGKKTLSDKKKAALKLKLAAELGISQDDIDVQIGTKPNPISRRLMESVVITVTFKVPASKAVALVATLEEPSFAAATGATFMQFKPAAGSSVCATCVWDGTRIRVTHYLNSQKNGEKGLQHKCYHVGGQCKCACNN